MFFKKKEVVQSVDSKVDELVKVIRDTVYEYDTGMAFSKRACVEIPLFIKTDFHADGRRSAGSAYFSAPRAPKCDYIVKDHDNNDHYFKKQADLEVARDGSPLKVKKVRAKAKTK